MYRETYVVGTFSAADGKSLSARCARSGAPRGDSAPRSEYVLASLVSLAERGVHCSGRGAAEEQLCGAFCIFLHISQENRRLRLTIDHQLR